MKKKQIIIVTFQPLTKFISLRSGVQIKKGNWDKKYWNIIPLVNKKLSYQLEKSGYRNLKNRNFIKIDSYGDNTASSGTVRLLKDISADITNRDVIIVEDIVDTGLSLNFLKHRLEEASPKSLRFVTCLCKPDVASQDFSIDWVGFNIDDNYVVGYGLDLKQIYRGLPGIYVVNEEKNRSEK